MARKNDKVHKAVIIGDADEEVALRALCPDLPQWPQHWRIESGDLAVGERLVEAFKPFQQHLIGKGLSPKTLKRQSVSALLSELIDDETGPLIWPRITESEQDAFDITCRKLHRFFVEQASAAQGR